MGEDAEGQLSTLRQILIGTPRRDVTWRTFTKGSCVYSVRPGPDILCSAGKIAIKQNCGILKAHINISDVVWPAYLDIQFRSLQVGCTIRMNGIILLNTDNQSIWVCPPGSEMILPPGTYIGYEFYPEEIDVDAVVAEVNSLWL
jgi:hypothetical protein